jgi:conserved oligomeric Golgi complex subunit 7
MVAVDVLEFGTEGFDPKRWINAALDARHPSELLDRFLADAEERLRAAADDAAAALERDSGDALRRIPLTCRDALRLREDAVALRSHLASVLQSLSQVPAPCPARFLLDLDHVTALDWFARRV